jgi:membrane associated rhomboid family serine protease
MNISAVKALIAANVIVFAFQHVARETLELWFALWPLQDIDGQSLFRLWQLVTYAFLHSPENNFHIVFNMIGLWMFGSSVEQELGPGRFLACYFASVVTAAISQLYVPILLGAEPAPTIGASGGVFGLLLAYALLFPRRKVIPLFPPIPMPAWLFAAIYAGVELWLGVTGSQASVAHFAHLGGMIGSALVILQSRRRLGRA